VQNPTHPMAVVWPSHLVQLLAFGGERAWQAR
jgi:hypothetical protein